MIMALIWTDLAGTFKETLYSDLLKLEALLAGDRLNGKLV